MYLINICCFDPGLNPNGLQDLLFLGSASVALLTGAARTKSRNHRLALAALLADSAPGERPGAVLAWKREVEPVTLETLARFRVFHSHECPVFFRATEDRKIKPDGRSTWAKFSGFRS